MFPNTLGRCACFCLVVSLAALMALPTGCKSCGKEVKKGDARGAASAAAPAPRIPVSIRPSAADMKTLAALKSQLRKGRVPKGLLKQKKHAKLFLYLAASSEDPKLIVAALGGMRSAYAGRSSRRGRPRANQDYGLVVATHLQSGNHAIQAAALRAAPQAVEGRRPYRPAVDELVSIAESHPLPGARVEALGVLRRVHAFGKQEAIVAAMLRALEQKEPAVLSMGLLLAIHRNASGLTRRKEFSQRAAALVGHEDAGVRGRAARLLGLLSKGDAQVVEQLIPLLEDQNPYVRGQAALAVAEVGDVGIIHQLMALVDDEQAAYYQLAYKSLRGKRARLSHGRKTRTVGDQAIMAVARLSAKTKSAFKSLPRDAKNPATRRKENVAAVKAWYAKHKATLRKGQSPPATAEPTRGPARPAAPTPGGEQ
jgi:hypothetical protein